MSSKSGSIDLDYHHRFPYVSQYDIPTTIEDLYSSDDEGTTVPSIVDSGHLPRHRQPYTTTDHDIERELSRYWTTFQPIADPVKIPRKHNSTLLSVSLSSHSMQGLSGLESIASAGSFQAFTAPGFTVNRRTHDELGFVMNKFFQDEAFLDDEESKMPIRPLSDMHSRISESQRNPTPDQMSRMTRACSFRSERSIEGDVQSIDEIKTQFYTEFRPDLDIFDDYDDSWPLPSGNSFGLYDQERSIPSTSQKEESSARDKMETCLNNIESCLQQHGETLSMILPWHDNSIQVYADCGNIDERTEELKKYLPPGWTVEINPIEDCDDDFQMLTPDDVDQQDHNVIINESNQFTIELFSKKSESEEFRSESAAVVSLFLQAPGLSDVASNAEALDYFALIPAHFFKTCRCFASDLELKFTEVECNGCRYPYSMMWSDNFPQIYRRQSLAHFIYHINLLLGERKIEIRIRQNLMDKHAVVKRMKAIDFGLVNNKENQQDMMIDYCLVELSTSHVEDVLGAHPGCFNQQIIGSTAYQIVGCAQLGNRKQMESRDDESENYSHFCGNVYIKVLPFGVRKYPQSGDDQKLIYRNAVFGTTEERVLVRGHSGMLLSSLHPTGSESATCQAVGFLSCDQPIKVKGKTHRLCVFPTVSSQLIGLRRQFTMDCPPKLSFLEQTFESGYNSND